MNKPKTKATSLRLPTDLHRDIKRAAKAADRSMAKFIIYALREAVNRTAALNWKGPKGVSNGK